MLRVAVVTIFPEMFEALTGHGISGRACREGLVELRCWNPRDYASDRHRSVDDRPYGGGPGMVMMAQPLEAAIIAAKPVSGRGRAKPRHLPVATGRTADAARVRDLAQAGEPLVLVCGRYEGIDERAHSGRVSTRSMSLGDYVLRGGEAPGDGLLDAVSGSCRAH